MPSSLRVARTDSGQQTPLGGERAAVFARHQVLTQIIARHLPQVTASLLAEPREVDDGSTVEWYSDLAGEPRRLPELPAAEQDAVRRLLNERVASVIRLADELPTIEPQSAQYSIPLRQAVSYPGDNHVYVVAGQPVLTFWGHQGPNAPDERAVGATPIWPWLAGVAALLLMALLLWWLWPHQDAIPVAETPPVTEAPPEPAVPPASVIPPLPATEALAIPPDPYADLRDHFEQSLGDCEKLAQFDRSLTQDMRGDANLEILVNRLTAELNDCRERLLAELGRRFETALGDCTKLAAFDKSLSPELRDDDDLQTLRNRLDAELDVCRKPRVDPRELCPGKRPIELAPDLVIVFDASGSMKENIPLDAATAGKIRQRYQSSNKGAADILSAMLSYAVSAANLPARISVAKNAARQLVSSLPSDVDIGLVVLSKCPSAKSVGFYKPAERSRLQSRIGSLQPYQGTPLGSAVSQAGDMVDGVDVQGIIVVISDGEESCGADVCGIARRLAAKKPRLVINTVDIMGTGAGDCLASATGGRVFTASNAQEITDMIQLAASAAKGPENCSQE